MWSLPETATGEATHEAIHFGTLDVACQPPCTRWIKASVKSQGLMRAPRPTMTESTSWVAPWWGGYHGLTTYVLVKFGMLRQMSKNSWICCNRSSMSTAIRGNDLSSMPVSDLSTQPPGFTRQQCCSTSSQFMASPHPATSTNGGLQKQGVPMENRRKIRST